MVHQLPRVGRQRLEVAHADRQLAQRPGILERTASIAIVLAARRAVVSGTMPIADIAFDHPAHRVEAAQLDAQPDRLADAARALSGEKRWIALARSSPTKS